MNKDVEIIALSTPTRTFSKEAFLIAALGISITDISASVIHEMLDKKQKESIMNDLNDINMYMLNPKMVNIIKVKLGSMEGDGDPRYLFEKQRIFGEEIFDIMYGLKILK